MPGGSDIKNAMLSIYNVVKTSARSGPIAPCDSAILKAHYRLTFMFFIATFFVIWHGWYHEHPIICVAYYNANKAVRLDYVNICLSYSFVEEKHNKRCYLHFYRWIHWVSILLAGVYYIPRKVSKMMENNRIKDLIQKLSQGNCSYNANNHSMKEWTASYLRGSLTTHDFLYYKFIATHFIAILTNLLGIYFLDFVLQGKFFDLGFKAMPFSRDFDNFTDYTSRTFPPFAKCIIDKEFMVTASREETLGCHLTLMELYEKIFILIWFWLSILLICSILHLLFFLAIFFNISKFILRPTYSTIYEEKNMAAKVQNVLSLCKKGDLFLLYCLKNHFSHTDYVDLLSQISDNLENRSQDEDSIENKFNDTCSAFNHSTPYKGQDQDTCKGSMKKRHNKGGGTWNKQGFYKTNTQQAWNEKNKGKSDKKSPAPLPPNSTALSPPPLPPPPPPIPSTETHIQMD